MTKLPNKEILKAQLKKLESAQAALDKTFGKRNTIAVFSIDRVKGTIIGLDMLERHGLLGLAEASDELYFGSFCKEGMSVSLYMRFPWNRQTEARHIYGGVFPEEWGRQLFLEGNYIVRAYIIKDNDAVLKIKFMRHAIVGEKIAGCTVQRGFRERYTVQLDDYYRPLESTMELYCPTGRR